MYVELSVAPTRKSPDPTRLSMGLSLADELEAGIARQRAQRLSIEHIVNIPKYHNVVILGDPGSGKTSLLRYLALEIAKGKLERWAFPVFISLRKYWYERQRYADAEFSLLHYAATVMFSDRHIIRDSQQYSLLFAEEYEKRVPDIQGLEEVLSYISGPSRKHVLLLLDGFDEIATQPEAIRAVTFEIERLGKGFSWVLTSRQTGYFGGLGEDARYEMVALSNPAIENLVTNWFFHQSKQPDSVRSNLLEQLQKTPRLQPMARNPFLLTLLCYLRDRSDRDLPLQRSEVYQAIVALIRKQAEVDSPNVEVLNGDYLGEVAEFCHFLYTNNGSGPCQIFERVMWDEYFSDAESRPALEMLYSDTRLLTAWLELEHFHFVHLTFQEYFIARHLLKRSLEEIQTHFLQPHWRMTHRFLMGMLWSTGRKDDYIHLLRRLLEESDILGMVYIEAAWWLVEAGVEDSQAILGYDLREQLLAIWSNRSPYVSDAAGEALALLSPTWVVMKVDKILSEDQVVSKHSKTSAISLLAKAQHPEADELLLRYFFSEERDLNQSALRAIAEKNTPEVRTGVIDQMFGRLDSWMEPFCSLSKKTRHPQFLPTLLAYLEQPIDCLMDYLPVFEAIGAINVTEAEVPLLKFVQSYMPQDFPVELINALIGLDTPAVRRWVSYQEEQIENLLDSEFGKRLLVGRLENGWAVDDIVHQTLKSGDEVIQLTLIEGIGDRADEGHNIDRDSISLIAEIAFSEHPNADQALSALHKIELQYARERIKTGVSSASYRHLLKHGGGFKAIDAMLILAYREDVLSHETIFTMAENKTEPAHIRTVAVTALGEYGQAFQASTLALLNEIARCEIKGAPELTGVALDTIGKLDYKMLLNQPHSTKLIEAKARVSAEQSIFF